MKSNELRIGNYVKHNSDWSYRGADTSVFQWSESDWYALGECTLSLENIEPIPLTEDWLLSFGFEKTSIYSYRNFSIELMNIGDKYFRAYLNAQPISVDIKHVHQLQNLFFALTGKELTKL